MVLKKEISEKDLLNLSKRAAAYQACQSVRDGMVIGLGTGSTAYYAIEWCSQKVAEGMKLTAVPSSEETKKLCEEGGIPLLDVNEVETLDLVIDGADEMDAHFHVIKGGGAALFREKVLAYMGKEVIWIMDESKLVSSLGAFGLPVEILPFGALSTLTRLEEAGYAPSFRCTKAFPKDKRSFEENKKLLLEESEKLLLTDNGNYLLDLFYGENLPLTEVQNLLLSIPGVVEHGLFLNYCSKAIIAFKDGHIEERENLSYVFAYEKP